MANITLVLYGELARGMLHSTSMIVDDLTKGVEVSCLYPGQDPQDYADQFRLKIENNRNAWVMLADILGGSVRTTLSQLIAFGDITVLSGVNLNPVLSVLLGDHDDASEKRMIHTMDGAKTRITCRKSIDKQEEEDFQEGKEGET